MKWLVVDRIPEARMISDKTVDSPFLYKNKP